MKERRKRTGMLLDDFTFGMVESTVWLNWAEAGGVSLKVRLRRLEAPGEGDNYHPFSFYPEDLEDIGRAVIRAGAWLKENSALLPGPRIKAPNTSLARVKRVK